jgi:hypothetical protein
MPSCSAPPCTRTGSGTASAPARYGVATAEARRAGAAWLHVDYEPHLASFCAGCGFRHTAAGLIGLAVT